MCTLFLNRLYQLYLTQPNLSKDMSGRERHFAARVAVIILSTKIKRKAIS